MSYTPTQWQTGDTITAERLNNMESGIENANEPFIVNLTPTAQDFSGTMDKTGAEITAAYEAGQEIVLQINDGNYLNTINVSYVRDGRPVYNYLTFVALFTFNNSVLVEISTFENTYSTAIYQLTPAT